MCSLFFLIFRSLHHRHFSTTMHPPPVHTLHHVLLHPFHVRTPHRITPSNPDNLPNHITLSNLTPPSQDLPPTNQVCLGRVPLLRYLATTRADPNSNITFIFFRSRIILISKRKVSPKTPSQEKNRFAQITKISRRRLSINTLRRLTFLKF